MSQEPKAQLNLLIPYRIWEKLEKRVKDSKKSKTTIVIEALERYLNEGEKKVS